jgi:hypothetical protein
MALLATDTPFQAAMPYTTFNEYTIFIHQKHQFYNRLTDFQGVFENEAGMRWSLWDSVL